MKWKDLMHSPPAVNLKLSPVAMIPHKKSRAFCCILDLCFTLKISKAKSVNESMVTTTKQQVPPEATNELGSVLKRIIAHLADSQF